MALDINGDDKVESDNLEYDFTTMSVFQNTLYFSARQIILNDDDFWSLRSYQGTGTSTAYQRTNDPLISIIPDQNKLYFVSENPDGSNELWTYQPGQPLLMLAPLSGRYSEGFDYEIVNGVMYYSTRLGTGLWRTDGTVCGTFTLNTGTSGAYQMEALGNKLIFASTTPEYGTEPFSFDLSLDPGNPCEPVGECVASGTITREYWGGVQGNRVSDIPLAREPTSSNELTLFEGPANIGTNYGTRIRGYICPPATGNYYFYISSNDHSELWLSNNEDPASRVRIAYVTGATGSRQWNKFPTQRSVAIPLIQGGKYFIEALHKQGVGTDHIAVGWELPNGTLERPIPGSHLSPFENNAATTAFDPENTTNEESYSQINIYPNPAQSGDPALSISGYEAVKENVETLVEITNMTGEVIFRDRITCGGNCSAYLMNINKALVPGIYLVNMSTNGTRLSKRLLVK